jgi:hypothetical protein
MHMRSVIIEFGGTIGTTTWVMLENNGAALGSGEREGNVCMVPMFCYARVDNLKVANWCRSLGAAPKDVEQEHWFFGAELGSR